MPPEGLSPYQQTKAPRARRTTNLGVQMLHSPMETGMARHHPHEGQRVLREELRSHPSLRKLRCEENGEMREQTERCGNTEKGGQS